MCNDVKDFCDKFTGYLYQLCDKVVGSNLKEFEADYISRVSKTEIECATEVQIPIDTFEKLLTVLKENSGFMCYCCGNPFLAPCYPDFKNGIVYKLNECVISDLYPDYLED